MLFHSINQCCIGGVNGVCVFVVACVFVCFVLVIFAVASAAAASSHLPALKKDRELTAILKSSSFVLLFLFGWAAVPVPYSCALERKNEESQDVD
jgi:hypothetical protein